MRYLLLLLSFIFSTSLISQSDTLGLFSFGEIVRGNYYDTEQPIWQNSDGDFFIKLSQRMTNIYASFGQSKKEDWITMIERFEMYEKKYKGSDDLGTVHENIGYPIKPEILRFRIFGDEEYMSIDSRLDFYFVYGLNGENKHTSMLSINVSGIQDSLDEYAYLDSFSLHLNGKEVQELKAIISRLK